MKEVISKQELKDIKNKYKGEERGVTFRLEASYILEREGRKGLEKLEKAMADLGYPIEYEKIRGTGFYPIIYEVLTLVLAQRLFNYKDEDFQKMGGVIAKFPSIMRGLIGVGRKLIFAIEIPPKMVSRIWNNYYTTGDLKIADYDKNKFITLVIKDFFNHPLNCQLIKGALKAVLPALIGKPITCEEVKCIHRGDKHHEFLIKW